MEIIKILRSKTFFYSLTTLISKISVFIIIPVSAIFLNSKDFSTFGIIFPTITLMTIASSFGLGSFILKKIPELGYDDKDKVISISISLWVIVNALLFLIISLITYFLFSAYFTLVVLTLGCCIFNSSLILNSSKHQLLDSNKEFLFFSTFVKVFYALEILIFIIIEEIDLYKIILSFFITSFIFFLISIYDNLKSINFNWINPFNYDINIIKFCFPLFLNSTVAYLLFINSRVILDYYSFIEYSSIYTLSYTFSAILTLLFATFISLYVPKIFTETSRVINNISSISESLSYLTLFISLFVLIIYKFYTESILDSNEFKNTSYYTAIFLASQFIYIYYVTKVDFLLLKNKTEILLYINVILAFVSLILNYIFIEFFGPESLFYTVLLTQLFLALSVSFFVRIKNNFKTIFSSLFFMLLIISISKVDSYTIYVSCIILLLFQLFLKRKLLINTINFLNEKNSVH